MENHCPNCGAEDCYCEATEAPYCCSLSTKDMLALKGYVFREVAISAMTCALTAGSKEQPSAL